MKATNINGTSDNTCNCEGGWLGHWEKFSGKEVSDCREINCSSKATVGAHVQKDSSTDRSWYIIPLCKEHNNKKGETLDLMTDTTFVSANVANTCGK